MQQDKVMKILDSLDETYGTQKDGFLHSEPWQLLIAIMLSAQSTDKQVDEALPKLFGRFKTLEAVAAADIEEIELYIKSVGLYHSKAKNMKKCCTQLLEEYSGKVPDTMEALTKLAGVGRKTANLFLADQYGIPGVTVDTHVHRVSGRLGLSRAKTAAKVEEELKAVLPKSHWIRINIQLIRHGRAVCRARKPLCGQCMLKAYCEYEEKSQ